MVNRTQFSLHFNLPKDISSVVLTVLKSLSLLSMIRVNFETILTVVGLIRCSGIYRGNLC